MFQAEGPVTAIRHCSTQSLLAVSLPRPHPEEKDECPMCRPDGPAIGFIYQYIHYNGPRGTECVENIWKLETILPTFHIQLDQTSPSFFSPLLFQLPPYRLKPSFGGKGNPSCKPPSSSAGCMTSTKKESLRRRSVFLLQHENSLTAAVTSLLVSLASARLCSSSYF